MRSIPAIEVVRLVLARELEAERRCAQELREAGYTKPSLTSGIRQDRPFVSESFETERALLAGKTVNPGAFQARDRACALCQLLRLSVEDTDLVLHNIFGAAP